MEPVRIRSTRANLAGVDLVPFPNVTIDQYGGFGGKTNVILPAVFLRCHSEPECICCKLYVVCEIDNSNLLEDCVFCFLHFKSVIILLSLRVYCERSLCQSREGNKSRYTIFLATF